MANYYTKNEISKNVFVIKQVKEEILHQIPIYREFSGEAMLTHIGAYRRIKFLFANKSFISEPSNHIAVSEDKTMCILLDNISFDKDIESNWKMYCSTPRKEYWLDVF